MSVLLSDGTYFRTHDPDDPCLKPYTISKKDYDMKIFSMFDTKASTYIQPFAETSTIAALRGFEVAVNEGKSTFSRFPDDFCLMELAEFDQNTGELIPNFPPLNLGSARTVLKQPESQNSLPFPQKTGTN